MAVIFVLGATGMLGHRVCLEFAGRGCVVVGTVRRAVPPSVVAEMPTTRFVTLEDAMNGMAVAALLDEAEPTAVINCAGAVRQRREGNDPGRAIELNALLPHRLAAMCADREALLVHISTDCVFDGSRGGREENELPDARDLYGRTKALGETLPEERSAVTLRTSFVGRELFAPPHGLVEWFLGQEAGATVDGYAGAMYSGLTSLELARVVADVVEAPVPLRGIHHVAGPTISKYALLHLLRDAFAVDVGIREASEPRLDRSLSGSAFSERFGYTPPSWDAMVAEMARDPFPYDELRTEKRR